MTPLCELLFRLADDEYVIAERYTEWQIYAPTIESDLALANIAQDEFGHARLWYDVLQDRGYEESELLWERDPKDFRHSTLCELAFEEGDWADPVVRSYLYDTAEQLRLEALVDSSEPAIADRVEKVLSEEDYHREHAQSWLERLVQSESHDRVQATLDRLFPHALSIFEPGEHEEEIVAEGLRTESLDSLREEWFAVTIPYLESLGLTVPEPEGSERPDARGRDGSHTTEWFDLHESFTSTYHELGFDQPTRLRGEGA
jgi:ring-1,2-phenylacetyl-CoA epoxidase subunit PaaC